MIFLGLNTGTSADAIDCVAIDFSGGNHVFIGGIEYPMPINLKADILKQVQADKLLIEDLIILKDRLSAHYIKAINKALSALNISVDQVCAVGIHGQTIHHKPGHNPPYSIQLADCSKISQQTRLNIVSDFRSVDIAVGGQGAPLIPAYQRFLLEQKNMKGAIFLNMGGIANISWIDRNQSGVFKGWDIGPCNSLMDLWVEKELGLPYDDAGSWAKSGDVISSLLDRFLQDSYFSLPSPKSTGREYFNLDWILANLNGECSKDVQATLLELTVETIARAFDEIALSGKEYKI